MASRIAQWLADARLPQILQMVHVIKTELTRRGVTYAWEASQVPTDRSRSKRYRLKLATWTVVREVGQPSPRILSSPQAAALLAQDLLREADDDKEHFWAVLLDTKNAYLMHTLVSVGTLSSSLVHPREVLGPALREGAASLILIHNHPSGDPTPSSEDLRLTRQLSQSATLLDLRLHDHVIIGNGTERWVSLADRGQLQ
jgi:DNA repair protein RadC